MTRPTVSLVVHSWTATDEACPEDDKKSLCQLLGKLYLPDNVDEDKIKTLKLLVYNLQSVGSALDVGVHKHD
jgi:hypothetical protein